MATYLLTWNPTYPDAFENQSQQAAETASGHPVNRSWSVGNTKAVQVCDRVFMLRQQAGQSGIVGAGTVTRASFEADHWNSEKGGTTRYIMADFQRILDPEIDPLLLVNGFESGPLSDVPWGTRRSGIQIPDDAAELLEQLWRQHLEQHLLLPVPPFERVAAEVIEVAHAKGQGFLSNPEHRRAVELAAMRAATEHFQERGYVVTDRSANHSYDLYCERAGDVLHVEVKGTQADGDEIILTPNEVEFARHHAPQMGLFILRSVQVVETDGGFEGQGGERRVIIPWNVDEGSLRPISYTYRCPKSVESGTGR